MSSIFDKKFQMRWDRITKKHEEEAMSQVTKEKWIWVEGYKGTDKDMKCRDYQFSLNNKYDMPEDAEIQMCQSGFHFCKDLESVFHYYDIKDGNRFFKINALVRESDWNDTWLAPGNKCVAKSVIFTSELTTDELIPGSDYSSEEKELIRQFGKPYVTKLRQISKLISLGYSGAFAEYIVKAGGYEVAEAVGTQSDLSMDMKVLMILKGNTLINQAFNSIYGTMTSAAASASMSTNDLQKAMKELQESVYTQTLIGSGRRR